MTEIGQRRDGFLPAIHCDARNPRARKELRHPTPSPPEPARVYITFTRWIAPSFRSIPTSRYFP